MKKGKKRAKGLLAKQIKRDYLKRELEYGRLTMTRCIQNWKEMITTISKKYLAEELLSCWHIFERAIDYKDLQISLLMDWLENELEQHRQAFSYHASMIDHFITGFQKSFKIMYEDLATTVNDMILEWTNTNNEILFRCQENEKYFETMIYQMSEITRKEEYEHEAQRFSLFDECRAFSESLLNHLKAIMQRKIEKLYESVLKFTNEHANKMEKKKQLYQLLASQHALQEKEISSNVKKIFSRKTLIQNLIEEFEKISEINGKHVSEVETERNKLNECFLTLRLKLFKDKKNDFDKRCLLVYQCNGVFDLLQAKAKEGTRMIKCLQSCRRYETIHEKLFPYPVKGKAKIDIGLEEHLQKYNLFWYKMASANESRCALNEECNYLKIENRKLKEQIHNHCQCFYCPVLPPIPKRAGRIPHTDGKQLIRKNKTQNRPK